MATTRRWEKRTPTSDTTTHEKSVGRSAGRRGPPLASVAITPLAPATASSAKNHQGMRFFARARAAPPSM